MNPNNNLNLGSTLGFEQLGKRVRVLYGNENVVIGVEGVIETVEHRIAPKAYTFDDTAKVTTTLVKFQGHDATYTVDEWDLV